MDAQEKNNIFLIKDHLESYESYLSMSKDDKHLFEIAIDRLQSVNTDQLNLEKHHNLVIIHKQCILDGVINDVISFFTGNHFNFSIPYFLIISEYDDETDLTALGYGDYIYYLPDKKGKENISLYNKNFVNFTELIFKRLLSDERLNSFIIDSFQNLADSHIVLQQKKEIEKLNKELVWLNQIDPLTKLLNRRAFFDSLEKLKSRSIVWSCLLIDIDHFKSINDNYGHMVGDEVLKRVGQLLLSHKFAEKNNISARYGGEEFIIILPGKYEEDGVKYAETLRKDFKNIEFSDRFSHTFTVTISIGVSQIKKVNDLSGEVLNRADKALYRAKNQGRDRVVLYSSDVDDD